MTNFVNVYKWVQSPILICLCWEFTVPYCPRFPYSHKVRYSGPSDLIYDHLDRNLLYQTMLTVSSLTFDIKTPDLSFVLYRWQKSLEHHIIFLFSVPPPTISKMSNIGLLLLVDPQVYLLMTYPLNFKWNRKFRIQSIKPYDSIWEQVIPTPRNWHNGITTFYTLKTFIINFPVEILSSKGNQILEVESKYLFCNK